jgi:alpha-tubulin suppressor-like RCC1 family protein
MMDEGFSSSSAPPGDASEHPQDEGDSKRAKTDATNDRRRNNVTNNVRSGYTVPREYILPIAPRVVKPGVLAQTGSLDSKMIGRTKRTLKEPYDLQEPTLLGYESIFEKQHVAVIATSSSACHSIVITENGDAYAWGRNEAGQCGFGTTTTCIPLPKKIELGGKFVAAAVGKSHSILVTNEGICYAAGFNKYGQCGVNSSSEAILTWRKCVLSNATGVKIVQVRI